MNVLIKGKGKITLDGFDKIKDNQIITIKYFGEGDAFNLVITPKEEEPLANRVVVKLVGRDIADPVIVDFIDKYIKKEKTGFIFSEDAYYQDDALNVDNVK